MTISQAKLAVETQPVNLIWSLPDRGVPLIKVAGGCALIALGAQVRIPLPGTLVPMTLQSLAVLWIGLTLVPALAVSATTLYVLCGAAGLPVFAAGSIGFLGPTGGYLVGFVAAAWLASFVKGSADARYGRLLLAATCASVALFTLGICWQIAWSGCDVWLSVKMGFLPFAVKEAVQILLVAGLVARIGRSRDARCSSSPIR